MLYSKSLKKLVVLIQKSSKILQMGQTPAQREFRALIILFRLLRKFHASNTKD